MLRPQMLRLLASQPAELIVILLALLLLSFSVSAQDEREAPILSAHQGLLAKAQANGKVPIIVELVVPDRLRKSATTTTDAAYQHQLGEVQRRVLGRLSGHRARRAGDIGLKLFSVFPGFSLRADEQTLQGLLADPEVYRVMENQPSFLMLSDSVPLIGADAPGSFDGYTGAGQTVAVLDTGVQTDHPFLSGKTVFEACYSTNVPGRSTSLCPGGDSQSETVGSGYHCDLGLFPGCFHGTHVAGIAVGSGNDFSGVARDADLIAMQVFVQIDDLATCQRVGAEVPCLATYPDDQMLALERVYELRNDFAIASVNMSLGGGGFTSACDTDPREAVIEQLRRVGIATVVASGNDGYTNAIASPACISSAVSVGNTTKDDQVNWSSNSAAFLDLLAPGTSIYSSFPPNSYTGAGGTSMAAPHVAGAWAVLAEAAGGRVPVDTAENVLKDTGVLVTDSRNNLQKPRINLLAAVRELTDNPTYYTITATAGVGGSITPGSVDVARGDTATFTLRPDTGYDIASVSGCNGSRSGNTYTTGEISNVCTVNASFSENAVVGQCGMSHGQTLTDAPSSGLCDAGTATTIIGSGPWAWTCQGVNGGDDAQCEADIQTYSISVNASPAGAGSVSCEPNPVNHGDSSTCSVTANSGYAFESWSGDCDGNSSQCVMTNVTAAKNITATFYETGNDEFHILSNFDYMPTSPATLPLGEYVDVTFDYATNAPQGVLFTAVPFSNGMQASSLTVASTLFDSGMGSLSFTIPAGEQQVDEIRFRIYELDYIFNPSLAPLWEVFEPVDFYFQATSHSIETSASPHAGGSVSCNPNPVEAGEDSTCTATANSGYLFDRWSGDCRGTSPSCTLSSVAGDKSVTGNFTQQVAITHTIQTSASPSAGGSVSCTPNPVDDGEDSTCTATANSGYLFTNWSGDCSGTDPNCTLSNVTGDKSVTANFTQQTITHAIQTSASPSAGGSVSCNPNPVGDSEDSLCTATANSGYAFENWSGDCNGTSPNCTLNNVTAAQAVTANFRVTSASSIQLNDTGIDWCADGDTNNLDCPVAGYPGQDGDYGRDALARAGLLEKVGAGAAGFDFTKLDANGQELPVEATDWTCVRDNVTGLIWEVKTTDGGLRDKDQTYTWDDSFTYASDVNTQGLCGFNDWRMPSIKELAGIAHMGRYIGRDNQAIDTEYFPNTLSGSFWSASQYASSADDAWLVSFRIGSILSDRKGNGYAVRLVRGGQRFLSFVSNGDGTVTDENTGLMWAQCSAGQSESGCSGSATLMNWQSALAYAENATLAGYDDWRLPNIQELRSLVDYSRYSPAIDTTVFYNTPNSNFWSASPDAFRSDYAWFVEFIDGRVMSNYHDRHFNPVRLVRDAQCSGLLSFRVALAGSGSGIVTSDPLGIDCGSDCSAEYACGTAVTLTATPATGSTLTGWSEASCGSATTCAVTLNSTKTVTATFESSQPLPGANNTIYLPGTDDNVVISTTPDESRTYLDFGGMDTYTLAIPLEGSVKIVDRQTTVFNLPAGLRIDGAEFAADGVRYTSNGNQLKLLGNPSAFVFVFAGDPLDPDAGDPLSYSETAERFGAFIPPLGANSVHGSNFGTIQPDGSLIP